MIWSPCKVNNVLSVGEMYSFFSYEYKDGYDFRGEAHNFWECLYVEEGCLCVTEDERVYNLTKNQIIFHKPMAFHKFRVTGKSKAKVVIFSFSLSGELSGYFANKVFTLSQKQSDTVFAMLSYASSKAPVQSLQDTEQIQRYLFAGRESSTYLQMLTTYMYQLFLSLAESETVLETSHAPDAKAFGMAVDYMNSNIDKSLLISDISDFLNISESSLKRIFFKYAGIGVHKYFMQIKIKAATQLLKSGISVSETAKRLGFSSQGYFSGVYKRETGIAPKFQKG